MNDRKKSSAPRSIRERDEVAKERREKMEKFRSIVHGQENPNPSILKNFDKLKENFIDEDDKSLQTKKDEKKEVKVNNTENKRGSKIVRNDKDDSCCDIDVPVIGCEFVEKCIEKRDERIKEAANKWLEDLLNKYRKSEKDCDLLNIINDFYPQEKKDDFYLFDVCDLKREEIQLNINDFYFGNNNVDSTPLRTSFEYKGCDSPSFLNTSLRYLPLTTSTLPDDINCSVNDNMQNSLQVQLTVPQNIYPGSKLKLRLSLLVFPPSADYIRQKFQNLGIPLPENGVNNVQVEKIPCPPPEVSAIKVSLDSIHLCDVKNDFKQYYENPNLPVPLCAQEDRFKLFGKSADFAIYEYRNKTEYSFTLINVDVIIRPPNPIMIRPGDLLVINIARTKTSVDGSDSPLTYGLASATLEYVKAPINLEDTLKAIYSERDKWGQLNSCGVCEPNTLDKCLNSFSGSKAYSETSCYDDYDTLYDNIIIPPQNPNPPQTETEQNQTRSYSNKNAKPLKKGCSCNRK